ncbi:MAG: outer membrane beta-barrel protein [Erythrobacter sp.]|nr:MAG: outer membrane beta-barrel protein [Erythrobacter sp.]
MRLFVVPVALCAAVAVPAAAQEANTTDSIARDGVRIEARATYETPTVSSIEEDDDVYKLGSAFAFGGEVGFDLAVSNSVVVGPYGQYEVSSVESCEEGFCVSTTDYLEAGLHIGVALNAEGQLFGKLGYGQLGFETSGLGLDSTETGEGVAFAAGYEHGFGDTFYGSVELGYADLGDVYGINFQRRHAGVTVGARF